MDFIGLKTNCLFCGNKSLNVSHNSSRESHLILMNWEMDSSRSFCQLLNLDPTKSMSSLHGASYCESCYQLLTDVLFLQRRIQSFHERLNDIKARSTSLILHNYKRFILREDSALDGRVGLGGHMDNEYYEALTTIGAALQPLPLETKDNKIQPDDWVWADLEETEDSVSTFLKVEVRNDEDTSDYYHQKEGRAEDDSYGVENYKGRLGKRVRRVRQNDHGGMDPLRFDALRDTDTTTNVTGAKTKRMKPSSQSLREWKEANLDYHHHFKRALTDKYGTAEMSRISQDNLFPFTRDPLSGERVNYSCVDCKFSSYRKEIYSAHVRQKHQSVPDPRPFHCPKCQKKFRSVNSLGSHFLKSHEVLHLTCDKCQRSLETWDNFKRHRETHRSDKLDVRDWCTVCSLRVTTEEKSAHEALHNSKSNPYACVMCEEGQDFGNQVMLQHHVKEIHAERFPCQNPGCPKTFSTKYCERAHWKRHHLQTNEHGGKCKCTWPGCSKALKNRKSLLVHIREIHQRRGIAKCHICDRVCMSKPKLKIHLLTHGEERGFLCDKCPYAAKTSAVLWQHINISHKLKENRISYGRGLGRLKSEGFGCSSARTSNRQHTTGEERGGSTGSDNKAHVPNDTDAICIVCARHGRPTYGPFLCRACRIFYRVHFVKEAGEMKQCDADPKGECIIAAGNSNCTSCRFKKITDLGLINYGRRRLEVDETLTACVVCGDETSSVYLGLRCCRPCYEFSIKSMRRNLSYKCASGETCIVGKGRRSCSYCRLKKCHQLGLGVERFRKVTKAARPGTPCAVCGDRTYTKSFGAFSCVACAFFFQAWLKSGLVYTCNVNESCEITKETRGKCRACRLSKCLQVGMHRNKVESAQRKGENAHQPEVVHT